MKLIKAAAENQDMFYQDSGISWPACINGLHHKTISGQPEKLQFIRYKYVSNSHQIIIGSVLQHKALLLVEYENIVQSSWHAMLFRASILPGESKISGKSSYILLGTVQEKVMSQAWMTEVYVFKLS